MATDRPSIFDVYPVLGLVSGPLQARIRAQSQTIQAADGHEKVGVTDPCTALPLIVHGAVRVLKPLRSGRILPLYTVGPGELCVLSVSCLLGDVLYPAAGRAAGHVAGVDVSWEMQRQAGARNRAAVAGGRADLRKGSAVELPFADASFDAVYSTNSAQFWPDLDQGMRELLRVLQPSGRALTVVQP